MPHYNLDSIREAATQQNIRYKGRRVNTQITELGYTLDDVSDCISSLTISNFSKTIHFPDSGEVFDVYLKRCQREEELPALIYIKLRLLETGEIQINQIELASFHVST